MRVYDCVVRLGNEAGNEVAKPSVTAAEIMVLRAIHGEGSVPRVQPRSSDKRSHRPEYDRLRETYDSGKKNPVFSLFGNGIGIKLPVSLEDVDPVEDTSADSEAE